MSGQTWGTGLSAKYASTEPRVDSPREIAAASSPHEEHDAARPDTAPMDSSCPCVA